MDIDRFLGVLSILIGLAGIGVQIAVAVFAPGKLRRAWIIYLISVGLIVGGIIIRFSVSSNVLQAAEVPTTTVELSSSTPTFIQDVIVPSTSSRGVQFHASNTGRYIFTYSRGGYTIWWVSSRTGNCTPSCWSVNIAGFRGTEVRWRGTELDEDTRLFHLPMVGWFTYPSLETAERVAAGDRAIVSMDMGDVVTLVVADCRECYSDNSGDIYIQVFFQPR